ncbi:ankyrin repeat domain-containing protein 27-like [Saccoglossus kowalevskii]
MCIHTRIMADSEDLDFNPFYKLLQTRFMNKFETAQKKCYLVCIPAATALQGININQNFVDTHILRPSPYFRSHYESTDKTGNKSIAIENGFVQTKDGFSVNTKIRILSEELSYNKDYKPFKILIIEKPLDPRFRTGNFVSLSPVDTYTNSISFQENKKLLFQFPEHRVPLSILDQNIKQFNMNYMILQGYLDHAAMKLQDMCFTATESILKVNRNTRRNADRRMVDILTIAVESYVMGCVHSKVFPAVCQKCCRDDNKICSKEKELQGVGGDEFGVKTEFCCPLPASVVELARLDGLYTPLEKLFCLKSTLDCISEEVNYFAKDNVVAGNEVPCIASDDLIPLLVTVLIQSKSTHLISNLYYIEHFHWATTSKDDLSFSLVTFKAATEYFLNTDFSHLKPLAPKMRNEMTLEEILLAKKEQENETGEKGERSRDSHKVAYRTRGGSFNRELDNITRMIEKTTTSPTNTTTPMKSLFAEYDQVQASGFAQRSTVVPPDVIPSSSAHTRLQTPLGDFLSSLKNDVLDGTYGKGD